MPKNKVQFQIGVSIPEFIEVFGTEKQCERYLETSKWPNGYKCVDCQSTRYGTYQAGSRKVYPCKDCRKRHRLTAGTIFHGSKTPLRTWFIAIHEITQSKNCVSALELHRRLGVNYKTAWLMKHKLMQLMYESDQKYKLQGQVEIDDAYLGGVKKAVSEVVDRKTKNLLLLQFNVMILVTPFSLNSILSLNSQLRLLKLGLKTI